MAFTALATRVYKDPITTVYLNSIKQNDDYLITGSVKTWINFDGSAASLSARASQNVSSITDISQGTFGINLTTGMALGSGYCVFGAVALTAANNSFPGVLCIDGSAANPLASAIFKIRVADFLGNPQDSSIVIACAVGASN